MVNIFSMIKKTFTLPFIRLATGLPHKKNMFQCIFIENLLSILQISYYYAQLSYDCNSNKAVKCVYENFSRAKLCN